MNGFVPLLDSPHWCLIKQICSTQPREAVLSWPEWTGTMHTECSKSAASLSKVEGTLASFWNLFHLDITDNCLNQVLVGGVFFYLIKGALSPKGLGSLWGHLYSPLLFQWLLLWPEPSMVTLLSTWGKTNPPSQHLNPMETRQGTVHTFFLFLSIAVCI